MEILLWNHHLSGNSQLPINNMNYTLFVLAIFYFEEKKRKKHFIKQYNIEDTTEVNNRHHSTRIRRKNVSMFHLEER